MQILETGLLPGKMIQQLNGQTQRLLGQQSLAGVRLFARPRLRIHTGQKHALVPRAKALGIRHDMIQCDVCCLAQTTRKQWACQQHL